MTSDSDCTRLLKNTTRTREQTPPLKNGENNVSRRREVCCKKKKRSVRYLHLDFNSFCEMYETFTAIIMIIIIITECQYLCLYQPLPSFSAVVNETLPKGK